MQCPRFASAAHNTARNRRFAGPGCCSPLSPPDLIGPAGSRFQPTRRDRRTALHPSGVLAKRRVGRERQNDDARLSCEEPERDLSCLCHLTVPSELCEHGRRRPRRRGTVMAWRRPGRADVARAVQRPIKTEPACWNGLCFGEMRNLRPVRVVRGAERLHRDVVAC